jgi:hypothetical protein
MQVSAPTVFPFRRNQPDGSRAFALLPPLRCYDADSGTLASFAIEPVIRFRTPHPIRAVVRTSQPADRAYRSNIPALRVEKRASNPEIACAVKWQITREASGECGNSLRTRGSLQLSTRFSRVAGNSALAASRIAFVAPSRCCRRNRARVSQRLPERTTAPP